MLITIFVILTPLVTGWALYVTTCNARQTYVYIPDEESATDINNSVRRYSANAEKIDLLLKDLYKVVYKQQNLQNTLAEEFLESGLAVDNFAVKNVSSANKTKTIPSKGGEDWKYFNFATVSLSGSLEADKISQFIFFLSTRPKLWHISTLDMQPMDTPADLVNRFQKIEMDITTQGRTFERDSLLEIINKRSNKNKISVSMTFFVPIAAAEGSDA
jgi:hypothetical protein